MTKIIGWLLGVSLLSLVSVGSALAHATLETAEAPANSTNKAVVRTGHGYDGKPTQALRVRIPEGVIFAKPMPKPSWQLTTTRGAYAKSYDYYGTPVAEDVTEIARSGLFRNAPHRWIEIPEAGNSADDYVEPAPGVTIVAKPGE